MELPKIEIDCNAAGPFRRRGSRRRSAVAQLTQPLAGANAGWPLQSRIRG